MSGFVTLGLCAGLLASLPPADGAGLAIVRAEAREHQRAGRYGAARDTLERFADRLDDARMRSEADRLVARYGALDHAWQRARSNPRVHGRTFVNVLVAGGRFVPATDEDIERAVCTLARGDRGLRDNAARAYQLDVALSGAGADSRAFERGLKKRLARCDLHFDSGAQTLTVSQVVSADRRARFGGSTRVAVDGRNSVSGQSFLGTVPMAPMRGPATDPTMLLGEKAAVRVMERVLLDVHHGRL